MRGLRLRTPQNAIVIEAFRTLDADVVPTPWDKAFLDALAQGAFDGMELDIDGIVNLEIFRSMKFLSLTGHIYAPAITLMSKVAYDKLSEADRRAFVKAAQLAAQVERKLIDDAEDAGLARLISVGMKINTDVDKAAFRAALAPAYARWRQRFGALIERIQAYP